MISLINSCGQGTYSIIGSAIFIESIILILGSTLLLKNKIKFATFSILSISLSLIPLILGYVFKSINLKASASALDLADPSIHQEILATSILHANACTTSGQYMTLLPASAFLCMIIVYYIKQKRIQ